MDLIAENLAERVMQDMGRRMVEHGGVAARPVDLQLRPPSRLKVARLAAQDATDVENRAVVLGCR